MTNSEKRVLRHTTKGLESTLALLVSMTDSAINAYDGTPAAFLYEKLYMQLRTVKDCPEFEALRRAGEITT